MREVLEHYLTSATRNVLPLKVGREEGQLQKHKGMHYHFKPEIFLQMQGLTVFHMPREQLILKPGEILFMPTGVPHREVVEPDSKGPFRNLVVGFYSNCLSLHFAYEAAPGKPDIEAIEFFDTPNLKVYVTLVQHLVASYHTRTPARREIINGLTMAILGMLVNVVETGSGHLNKDIGKIFQTKWIVREQFANPELNVKHIAERLHCSPDYLSHLFHRETDEKLVHYIQRIRIEGAMLALESTQLYVSEIAWSSGFQDPAYFARVFKKFTGETPQSFRARIDTKRAQQEEAPKTVYYDHVDYSPGEPVG